MRGLFATNAACYFLLDLGRFLVHEDRQLVPVHVQAFGACPMLFIHDCQRKLQCFVGVTSADKLPGKNKGDKLRAVLTFADGLRLRLLMDGTVEMAVTLYFGRW